MKVSDDSWVGTILWYHILGLFGAHRFYVGRWVTGLIWLFTLGVFGIGALVDGFMLYTGNFTDADGALVLPLYKRLLLDTIKRQAGPPAPQQQQQQLPPAQSGGVIHLNRIKPDNTEYLAKVDGFISLGLNGDGENISDLALLKASGGNVESRYNATAQDVSPHALLKMLGSRALLIGYDIRAKFPAIAALLKDVDANAEWDYIDLKELAEAKGVEYAPKVGAYEDAQAGIELFERCRGLD